MKTRKGVAPTGLLIALVALLIATGCGNDETAPTFGNAAKGDTADSASIFKRFPIFRTMLHTHEDSKDACGALRKLLFLDKRDESVLKIVESNHKFIQEGTDIAFSGFKCTDSDLALDTEWDGFSFKFEKANGQWLFTGTRPADCYEEDPTTVFSCDVPDLCSMEIRQPFITDQPECGAKEECQKVLGMFPDSPVKTCESVARGGLYQRFNDRLFIRYDHYMPEPPDGMGVLKVGTLDLVLQPVR